MMRKVLTALAIAGLFLSSFILMADASPLNTSKLGESGIVIKVVDGDTFDVEGIGRIRLADVNTPEMDTEEGREAKEYVKGLCYRKKVYLDIDDLYVTGKYGRIIAVVYVPYNKTHYVN
ncbi:MAG: thermonuclease family protein, partial [Halobacteriota archaeon]